MGILFSIAMWIHIGFGTVAALIIFPIQILGPKGRWHPKIGRIAVAVAWIIALSGLSMLVNPLFNAFWLGEAWKLSVGGVNYETYFADMTYEPLFFLYLDVILLYLVITGVGVWKRLERRRPDGSVPARPMDIAWNVVMAGFALAQLSLGIVDLDTDSGYAHSAIHVAIVIFALVAWDVWTWRDGGRRIKRWWTIHAGKMVVAWAGLFFAVLLRWQIRDEVLEQNEAWIVLGWAVLVASALTTYGFLQHARRTSKPAASSAVDAQG